MVHDQPNARAASGRPCVVLISPHSSYRLAPYIDAVARVGAECLVVSEGEYSLVEAVATGLHVSFSAPQQACQQVLRACRDQQIIAVIGTDDRTVELAASIARAAGLQHNAPASSILTRRKDLARACLSQAGLPVPEYRLLSLSDPDALSAHGLSYPCVVKPLSLSGSRGVIRVDSDQDLAAACRRIAAIVTDAGLPEVESGQVLLEQYIPGYEYAYEGMLHQGELIRLALFDKPDLMQGPYFEETYYISPSRLPADVQTQIHTTVQQACIAYGLVEGPVHAELRLHEDRAWIMEIAGRTIGGECARVLDKVLGIPLEEAVIRAAAGMSLPQTQVQQAVGVLMIPVSQQGILRRVEGVMRAEQLEYIDSVQISIGSGNELVPLPEGDSYLGFIFASAPTPAQVEQALRESYACLRIVTAPVFGIRPAL